MEPCSIADCHRPQHARGWCKTHYGRWRLKGDPTVVLKSGPKVGPPKRCIVAGCTRRVHGHGLCDNHYRNWERNGQPHPPTHEELFWALVDRDGPLPAYAPHLGPCWLWTGHLHRGYGTVKRNGRLWRASRYSYFLTRGYITRHLDIDHLCRVVGCVRPSHLELVTKKVNTYRAVNSPTGINARKTVCNRGHALAGDNVGYSAKGYRSCLACRLSRATQ